MAKRTINYNYDTSKNLLGKPNVFNSNMDVKETNVHIYDSLVNVVALHPDWKFVAINHVGRAVTAFKVIKNDEVLGEVEISYRGSGNKIEISNSRIGETLSRGKSKYTEDPEKAEKIIRKFFYPKGRDERMVDAQTIADNVVRSEAYDKESKLSKATSSLMVCAQEFVQNNMVAYISAHPGVEKHIPKYEQAKLDMETVTSVKNAFGNGKSVLVVLDESEYIVRDGNVASVYNNDTLPENLRAKIGMLKLVEPKQMISGVGCKASATVLVLIDVEPEVQAQP